jgi:hypothetical protein
MSFSVARRLGLAALLAGVALAVMPSSALAAPAHPAVMLASGSIFSGIAHALLVSMDA